MAGQSGWQTQKAKAGWLRTYGGDVNTGANRRRSCLWSLLDFDSLHQQNTPHQLQIFPLPFIYVLNLISGLGGTQKLNLPMFTVLRRFSILMTMILERVILGVSASFAVRVSVGLMILGSIIAAIYDLTFSAYGYSLILINDICTAANGVYMKQKLEARELGKYGLLYYNALFMLIPTIAFAAFTDEFHKVSQFVIENGISAPLVICFLLSCVCGFLLNYSVVLCTHYNSALTTTCVGPIKNLFVTYVGMFSSGDYFFQWTNFIGINVSVLGSILYTYVTFRTKPSTKERLITVKPCATREGDSKPLL
ncbi:UDP-sugar transporter sqv-7 [Toxocara canis]|uniref:UDP-sugar transporter sqv-7 n=1 Tax=Toxocara canis TaxID=6265 RepID=A0A0B2W1U7_TOXCA|nr:UDP-sugar transporter sqv-7 [Toxocara canis]